MRLELRGVTKTFGSLVANDHIDLTVEPGEIHALLGENGAGKTTLMNVLYGLMRPDSGEIVVDGEAKRFANPGDAIAAGIGMVHQKFMLVPVFTVAENVMLGSEPTRRLGWLDRRRARRSVVETSERFGLAVDPDALVEDLPVGVQQRAEILKALSRDAGVLILDEPTAVLTPQETEALFTTMRSLRAAGRSVVFISHKLKEVRAIADRITVIRLGKVIGEASPASDEQELASMMVGRTVQLNVDKGPAEPGEPALSVRGLTVIGEAGQRVVDDVSFDVHAGEIFAVAGVQGNGQTELVQALLGLREIASGGFTLAGHDLTGRDPVEVLAAGVGYVPEDRHTEGLVADFPVADNLVLDHFRSSAYATGISLKRGAIARNAAERITEFDIRTQSAASPAGTLSGGNQQKIIMARALSRPLRLLVAAQPTRGLDVGSIQFVHARIVEERDKGAAVVIVSSELDEVFALADRIAVMYQGRITATVGADESRERVGLLMAGGDTGDRPS
jgi:simple sugar transport system ATP-binding protein